MFVRLAYHAIVVERIENAAHRLASRADHVCNLLLREWHVQVDALVDTGSVVPGYVENKTGDPGCHMR